MSLLKKTSLLCLPWFLAACSTLPQQQDKQAPAKTQAPKSVVKPQPAPVDSAAEAPAAVISLLDRADRQEDNQEHAAAIASLERAIRIAPRYPESYYRLAELHYKQGSDNLARTFAQKSISLGAEGMLRRQAEALLERILF
ncbi:tetratricopeptide repeat protein [Psychromonas ossibalaenae]|uniref:tetratricopeptide repeat protein n=1 Tax=Psychromonas ossibalaenae TaxID=444922 RepID=UPI00037446BE|nr:tetratricopeptide repeat protein [Psychromonas ossibalaenae]